MSNISKHNSWNEPTISYQYLHEANKNYVPKKASLSIEDLFPRLNNWAIGFDPMFSTLSELSKAKASYPPYNISRDGDNWEIEVAVAGFKKDDLKVSVEDRTLAVSSVDSKEEDSRKVLHQGIAKRAFNLKFALAEYVEVKKVKLEDGLLTISLETELPEEKKPKVLDIE